MLDLISNWNSNLIRFSIESLNANNGLASLVNVCQWNYRRFWCTFVRHFCRQSLSFRVQKIIQRCSINIFQNRKKQHNHLTKWSASTLKATACLLFQLIWNGSVAAVKYGVWIRRVLSKFVGLCHWQARQHQHLNKQTNFVKFRCRCHWQWQMFRSIQQSACVIYRTKYLFCSLWN